MKNIMLFIWQLPQNILGSIVILISRCKSKNFDSIVSIKYWYSSLFYFGVSLGEFIIIGKHFNQQDLMHEYGHQKQSRYLGWLYLLIIGLPSFLGNIYDRLFHKSCGIYKRYKWYYNLPWEKWADKLGNVNRFKGKLL